MRAWLVCILLTLSFQLAANPPCDRVLERAQTQTDATVALELLGSCLASRAQPGVHQRVAVEMAHWSILAGNKEDALRYLDILRDMLEPDTGQNNSNKTPQ